MAGQLEVASTPGVGTTFSVELPIAEAPTLALDHLPPGSATTPSGPRRSVLYIEDNPSNLHLVARVFERAGSVDLITAMQGRQGIELAEHHHPALVLLDLHLPDMDGIAVLQELRDDPRTAELPIVVLSADATPGMIGRLLDAGATGYLAKPIDVAELLRVLDEHALAPT
jgi:CheY-like chemotaxis protein